MPQRTIVPIALLLAALTAFGSAPSSRVLADVTTASSTASAPSASVAIDNYAFKPATLTVAVGTTVTWTNKDDDPHTVTADDGAFDSKGLGQGDTFKHTFDKLGSYAYHCAAHPYMKGVVVVQGSK